MKNAPSMSADTASPNAAPRPEWKRPMLDILALADAQHGNGLVHDGHLSKHRS
jgi:hypothetical protein